MSAEAVAWRVKDYADGWILFHHEAPARKSGEARNGALVQALYTHPPQPDALGWRDIATAPRDGTMLLVGYDDGVARVGAMPDSQRVFEARWNDVQGTWSARNGFLLHSDATHWQPLPPPPSADTKRSEPDALPGDLREKVARIVDSWAFSPVGNIMHTERAAVDRLKALAKADAILSFIQSERGGA